MHELTSNVTINTLMQQYKHTEVLTLTFVNGMVAISPAFSDLGETNTR